MQVARGFRHRLRKKDRRIGSGGTISGASGEMFEEVAKEAGREVEIWAEYEVREAEMEKIEKEREKHFFKGREGRRIWFLVKVKN